MAWSFGPFRSQTITSCEGNKNGCFLSSEHLTKITKKTVPCSKIVDWTGLQVTAPRLGHSEDFAPWMSVERVILGLYDCWWLLPHCCQPSLLKETMMWATGGQGSFSQPCLWASTKPAEKDSLWCRSDFWLMSVKLWQWCSLWFSHLRIYSFSYLYHVKHYGISQRSETIFPSQLPGVALPPLALNWQVSSHSAFCCPTLPWS